MTGSTLVVPRPVDATRLRSAVHRLVPWLSAFVVLAVGVFAIDGAPVGAARDDSMYVILAKSLATGHGYRWLHIPGTPAATHFPPGYPAVLALLWIIGPVFPANILLFKLANVLFASLAAFGIAKLVRSRLGMSEIGSQAFALASMLAVPMLTLATQVMSEPLFLALTVATLVVAERVLESPERRTRDIVALALLAGAVTLVRTHGVALLAAIPLALCMRRRFHETVLFACVAAAVVLPWQLWVALHANVFPEPMRGNYESYLSLVTDAVRSHGVGLLGRAALRTAHDIGIMLQYAVAPVAAVALRIAALVLFLALTAIGSRVLWRRMPATLCFVSVYMAIVLFWPYTPGRFVWCAWPVLVLMPVAGVRELLSWSADSSATRIRRGGVLVASAALICGYVAYNLTGYRQQSWSTSGYAAYLRPLLVQVATRAPRNELIATEAEGTVYLYTGRTTVPVGSFMATDYLRPRSPIEYAQATAIVLDRYRPAAVFVTTGFLRNAMRDLALTQPPRLAVVDTFAGGGLVLAPAAR